MNTFKIKQFFSDKYADFRRYVFDKFFYNNLVEIFEDEFAIMILAYENDKKIAESTMKHLPQVGITINFIERGEVIYFKVESILLSHNGAVCKCYGTRTKELK